MESTWLKIASAMALALFVIILFPRARDMLKNAPKAQSGDWQALLIPLAIVILVVVLLIQMA